MYFRTKTERSTEGFYDGVQQLRNALKEAQAVVIGAGAGLSVAAGLTYSGERFKAYFSDFRKKYAIQDMYSGGFYPFESPEEYWAWWSRHIYYNRYVDAPKPVYSMLLELVKDKDYFVLTTNVDHQFQKAGFDKNRLFYTQGDYGLWQCSLPCRQKTWDNEEQVRQMIKRQKDMRIPPDLIPVCPFCGRPAALNLRMDAAFAEDEGWHRAAGRYEEFLHGRLERNLLFLELGAGMNTPGIIKYPFWQMTAEHPGAVYVCINKGEAYCPKEIQKQSVCIDGDIEEVLRSI